MTQHLLLALVLAAKTATASASPGALPTPTTQDVDQNIVNRVEKVKNSPTLGTSTPITFGIFGTLTKIVGSSLQVQTVTGALRLVELDTKAVVLRGLKQATREDLELGSPIIIMGTVNENQQYVGRRILLSDETIFAPSRVSFLGTIQTLTTKFFTVISAGKNDPERWFTSAKTKYFDTLGGSLTRSTLIANDKIVAIFADPHTASSSALRVYSLTTKPKVAP
ncbi:MAG TPA: hypothetical protein VLH19_01585 [Patescibacteria group bacterium]|nr:hypothetical protein [Patescibacteria group bacterium]